MEGSPLGRHLFPFLALLAVGSGAAGQQWARDMFNATSHDFGTVARGAKVEFAFVCENIYEEEAHIQEVRSTCGCTTTEIDQRLLKTWEKAVITASVDTRAYLGQKDATLPVVLDKPFPAEVRLQVHCYIRSDVVVQPGAVELGTATEGTQIERKVAVTYAGRPDWRIERIENNNPHLHVQAVETKRAGGQVAYDLSVALKGDAPIGYIRDHLVLVTNDGDSQASRVPVLVEGIVTSSFDVRPSSLDLGVVPPGTTANRNVVIKAQKPFRILSVTCEDGRFQCQVPEQAKPIQVLPVSFTSAETSGKVAAIIHIHTDETSAKDIRLPVRVQIVPPEKRGPGTP
jgi:hypothetical protein